MVAEKSTLNPHFGAHGEEEIPVLIPNTEVKLFSGDYTATSGKLARRRIIERAIRIGWLFSCLIFSVYRLDEPKRRHYTIDI
jgi:hypothetical protein